MNEPIKVFIGFDQVEAVAWHTLVHSIMSRSSKPVEIIPVSLKNFSGFFQRDRDPLQSNDFSFSRWLVPYLCNYEGRAIFMDCDMVVLDDINNLWEMFDDRYAVQCVKHNHVPKESIKYLGQTQTKYEKKNWSSVMLFNNEWCYKLTPDYVQKASGLDLHQFKWLEDDNLIGTLPLRWNFLVGYYDKRPVNEISLLHWTIGGPYFEEFFDCDYAEEWWEEYNQMTFCMDPASRSKI